MEQPKYCEICGRELVLIEHMKYDKDFGQKVIDWLELKCPKRLTVFLHSRYTKHSDVWGWESD